MTDYRQTAEVTPEEKRLILRNAATRTINRIDPDEEWRRIERKKKERQQLELETKQNIAKSEQQLLFERRRQEAETNAILSERGWKRFPLPPREQYFVIESCPFGCGDEVAFLAKNSPSVSAADSFETPYDFNNGNNDNPLPVKSIASQDELKMHLCKDVSGSLANVIHYLLRTNLELRKQMAKDKEEIKNYAAWSSSRI